MASTSRHPGDLVRILLGATGIGVALLGVQRDHLTLFERDLFRLVNDLPGELSPGFVAVMQAGNVFAAGVAAVIALLLARRWRPTLDLLVAGPLAWLAARFIKDLVQRPRPGQLLEDVLRYGPSEGLGFVSGHAAVAAALVTAAAPYLPRAWRRAAWALPGVVGFARIYEGAHLPLDIVGGLALGWMVGASIHLALGAPHRVPGLEEAMAVLRKAGWPATNVERVPGRAQGSVPFVATVAGEAPVFVKLLDAEPRDRDWLFRVARFLALRSVRDEAVLPDARSRADHEAAMMLLARCHGVRVPVLRRIERAGSRVWLVQDHVPGTSLDRCEGAVVDAKVLRDLWAQLTALRAGGLAHRDLVGSNVLVDDQGRVWLVDFAHAQSTTRRHALDNDVAELIVSTALVVGASRAVKAAIAGLGADAVAEALPELQPLALTVENRRNLRSRVGLLDEVRNELLHEAGLAPTLVTPEISRVSRTFLATIVGLASAVSLVIVGSISTITDHLTSIGWRWLGAALLTATVAVLCDAAAHVASVDRRLALGRTALVRVVARSNEPTGGAAAANRLWLRHLERVGVGAAEGRDGLRRLRGASVVAWAVIFVIALFTVWEERRGLATPPRAAMLGALGVGFATVQIVAGWRDSRNDDREHGSSGATRPSVTAVIGLSVLGERAAAALSMVAAVGAFGGGPGVGLVVLIYLAARAFEGILPVAAPGTTEILLVAGLSSAGMALAPAVLATLASRLLLFWAPFLVGRVLEPNLRRRQVL